MRVYARHDKKHYRLNVSLRWCERNDNGALVSCGLTVGQDLRLSQLKSLIASGKAKEVTESEYNHSGCQSACTLRGDATCRW